MYFFFDCLFSILRIHDEATCLVLTEAADAESELYALVTVPDLSRFGVQGDLVFMTVLQGKHVVTGRCATFVIHRADIRVLLTEHDTLRTDLLLVWDHPCSVLPCALLAQFDMDVPLTLDLELLYPVPQLFRVLVDHLLKLLLGVNFHAVDRAGVEQAREVRILLPLPHRVESGLPEENKADLIVLKLRLGNLLFKGRNLDHNYFLFH